nr:hypothetical protein HAGR004_14870 [Bdellovibrio sp. HAGR004]
MNRPDCVDFYRFIKKQQSTVLFLNCESADDKLKDYYATCDFWNAMRLSFRIVARLQKKRIRQYTSQLQESGYKISKRQHNLIASCIGDYYFNRLLGKILSKNLRVYYVGAVIPQTEKFENLLQSYEIQHGVIHSKHYNYNNVPNVRNGLIVYHQQYLNILKEIGYSGPLEAIPFKSIHSLRNEDIRLDVVLYTQPSFWPSPIVKRLFQELTSRGIQTKIKKHPRDYESYDLDESAFINAVTPNQVLLPVVYNSTIVENYLIHKKDIAVFDPNKTLNLKTDSCFQSYVRFQEGSQIFYSTDPENLVEIVETYISNNKRE